jgi:hypothetical protein
MIEVMSKAAIFKYLNGLIAKGTKGQIRDGPTLNSLGQYMGISRNDMLWYGRLPTARMSKARQMHFSKVIAMIENGQLEFRVEGGGIGRRKVAVLIEKPRPVQRFQAQFGPRGPTLRLTDRPKPPQQMPTFRAILGKD